jgi:hypothetical protein
MQAPANIPARDGVMMAGGPDLIAFTVSLLLSAPPRPALADRQRYWIAGFLNRSAVSRRAMASLDNPRSRFLDGQDRGTRTSS